jgi:hypothetical protein
MILTVVFDGLLTRVHRGHHASEWRMLRLTSTMLILAGGWLTFGSSQINGWFHVSLAGELMIWAGYGLWIGFKTYQGEGNRTQLSRMLRNLVLVD